MHVGLMMTHWAKKCTQLYNKSYKHISYVLLWEICENCWLQLLCMLFYEFCHLNFYLMLQMKLMMSSTYTYEILEGGCSNMIYQHTPTHFKYLLSHKLIQAKVKCRKKGEWLQMYWSKWCDHMAAGRSASVWKVKKATT